MLVRDEVKNKLLIFLRKPFRDDETIKYQFKMILFPPKSRYFKSNMPDIIFKIECFRQKNNSPKIDTLLFHRPLESCELCPLPTSFK
jgi:hypothetical protein